MKNSVEERILAAMAAGEFDNLAGQGQPLLIKKNPYAGDMELAYKILADHGFSLPWIEERNDIEAELAQARVRLGRTWSWYNGSEPAQRAWDKAKAAFTGEIAKINGRILTYNLKAPNAHVHMPVLDAEQEIAKVQEIVN
jgi:hypothetical protein